MKDKPHVFLSSAAHFIIIIISCQMNISHPPELKKTPVFSVKADSHPPSPAQPLLQQLSCQLPIHSREKTQKEKSSPIANDYAFDGLHLRREERCCPRVEVN